MTHLHQFGLGVNESVLLKLEKKNAAKVPSKFSFSWRIIQYCSLYSSSLILLWIGAKSNPFLRPIMFVSVETFILIEVSTNTSIIQVCLKRLILLQIL